MGMLNDAALIGCGNCAGLARATDSSEKPTRYCVNGFTFCACEASANPLNFAS